MFIRDVDDNLLPLNSNNFLSAGERTPRESRSSMTEINVLRNKSGVAFIKKATERRFFPRNVSVEKKHTLF